MDFVASAKAFLNGSAGLSLCRDIDVPLAMWQFSHLWRLNAYFFVLQYVIKIIQFSQVFEV
jgi:hypothetical protein